jgi:RimJ/RimL family protein N-acetyltransferase
MFETMHQTVSGFTEVPTTETSLMTGVRVNPHNRIVLKEIKKHVHAYLNQQSVHVRQLRPRHVHKISQHLLALPEKDRYLRFGYLPSDEQIERYVARLDFSQCTLFGVFDTDLVLQGVSQLSYIAVELSAHTAEFGVSVSDQYRSKGLGKALFLRCIAHARNQGVQYLVVHTLRENARMIHMARSAGAIIQSDGGDSLAKIELPPATVQSLVVTYCSDLLAKIDYRKNRWLRVVKQAL